MIDGLLSSNLNFFYGDDEVEVDVDDGDGNSDVIGITV